MTVRFIVTEHPPALNDELETHFERIRERLEDLVGASVVADVYTDVDRLDGASAVVLSGSFGPWAEHDPGALIRLGGLVRAYSGPVLGICAGMQLQVAFAGGSIGRAAVPAETGYGAVEVLDDGDLLRGLPRHVQVYKHHSDEVTVVPDGFRVLATSLECAVEAMAAIDRPWWGTQFHPEEFDAAHPVGELVLRNFFELVR